MAISSGLKVKKAVSLVRPGNNETVLNVQVDKEYAEAFEAEKVTKSDRRGLLEIKKALDAQPKFKVLIQATESNGVLDDSDVPVVINGYIYNIQRGKEVTVPESVVEILKHAKIETEQYKIDEAGIRPTVKMPVEIQRYPFSVLGPA